MEIRFLDASDVRQSLPMVLAIEAMKDAFAQLSMGKATVPMRSHIEVKRQDGIILFMPALLHESQDLAIKIVSVFPKNIERDQPTINALVIAIDTTTGMPKAVMEGASLTAIRTGAASGAATDLLAREDATIVAIFGSGVQARTQLEAVCTIRKIQEVRIYSLDKPGARTFVEEMAGIGPIPKNIQMVNTPKEAIIKADIICTATTSSTPVFNGKDLEPGTHINAIGSFTPEMQELDIETVVNSLVVVDSREAALIEAGDLIIPIEKGVINPEWIYAEVGELVRSVKPGRTNPDQITLFKSVGVAVQDAISASLALARAEEIGLGKTLRL
ncbi:MAG TPA: ornithine cyclodeaminase family protein [Anaerolineae bacterium]|nr:ornithine cyclodeaminase family protein [Anaerolineae bacterium]